MVAGTQGARLGSALHVMLSLENPVLTLFIFKWRKLSDQFKLIPQNVCAIGPTTIGSDIHVMLTN
jgi:cytochrome bd-type quinol oxidase subunit 1